MKLLESTLRGFSSCEVYLNDNGQVEKFCGENYPLERFNKQIEKHKKFLEEKPYLTKFIDAPIIFETKQKSYVMEYVWGQNFFQFINSSSLKRIKNTFNEILENINLRCCIDCGSDYSKEFSKKCLSLNLDFNVDKLILPNGNCHGDLSLSNIIFCDDKTYFIDFLDSYIESPIIDIIKLRQDTKHKFILFANRDKKIDFTKAKMILDYIDQQIVDFCNKKIMTIDKNYNLLQILNLYKIIPYVQTEEKEYIKEQIRCI